MGAEYGRLSQLMTIRQQIPGAYNGFLNYLTSPNRFKIIPDEKLTFINSQGAIEQVFKGYMVGDPLINHKDCSKLSWDMSSQLEIMFVKMFTDFYRTLKVGGKILLYANGAKNVTYYDNLVLKIIAGIDGLELDMEPRFLRLHKIKKVS